MARRFTDRLAAGVALGAEVASRVVGEGGDVLVLGLARGGVVVAAGVASVLAGHGVPAALDAFAVRKLGVPGQPELAMGAIASGGVRVLNDRVVRALRIGADSIERVAAREAGELARREAAYRGDRPAAAIGGRVVVVVDDGLATGSTMLAAIGAVRAEQPARIVVAVPVGATETCATVAAEAGVSDVVCLESPRDFPSVGEWYADFTQTTDDDVRRLLSA